MLRSGGTSMPRMPFVSRQMKNSQNGPPILRSLFLIQRLCLGAPPPPSCYVPVVVYSVAAKITRRQVVLVNICSTKEVWLLSLHPFVLQTCVTCYCNIDEIHEAAFICSVGCSHAWRALFGYTEHCIRMNTCCLMVEWRLIDSKSMARFCLQVGHFAVVVTHVFISDPKNSSRQAPYTTIYSQKAHTWPTLISTLNVTSQYWLHRSILLLR